MKSMKRFLVGAALCLGTLVPLLSASSTDAGAATFTSLHLINGWTASPFATNKPRVTVQSGVVTFQGAMDDPTTTSTEPFVLPSTFRPAVDVYVPVDLCNATNGRLLIQPDGSVFVEEQDGMTADMDCFTSLDGVSFVQSSAVTPLTLLNGWSGAPFGTANAAVTDIGGVVHFQGAVSATSPTSTEPFTLPSNMTPAVSVFVPVDMCNATNGRLNIAPSGAVTLTEEDGGTANENCFTSLDGATFVVKAKNPTLLTLKNGWTGQPFGTGSAVAELSNGVVRLQGAISGGSLSKAFKLPATLRPTTSVFVQVDLCNANNGRIDIKPTGVVSVEQEGGGLGTNAQCFTSLDGASFAP